MVGTSLRPFLTVGRLMSALNLTVSISVARLTCDGCAGQGSVRDGGERRGRDGGVNGEDHARVWGRCGNGVRRLRRLADHGSRSTQVVRCGLGLKSGRYTSVHKTRGSARGSRMVALGRRWFPYRTRVTTAASRHRDHVALRWGDPRVYERGPRMLRFHVFVICLALPIG